MATLNLHDTAKRKALSARSTARSIQSAVSEKLVNGSVTIDLADTLMVTPSFFDELLHVIQDSSPSSEIPALDLTNTSDIQFDSFRAVCRAHGLSAENIAQNHWRITKA